MRRFGVWARALSLAGAGTLALAVGGGAPGCGSSGGEGEGSAGSGSVAPDPGKPAGKVLGKVGALLGPVAGAASGLEIVHAGTGAKDACDAADCAWVAAAPGMAVGVGTELRTDALTRARVLLDDGTALALDTGTELRFEGARAFRVRRGAVFADVSPASDGAGGGPGEAHFVADGGEAVVKGTKLLFAAKKALASLVVSRGEVELRTKRGAVKVGAGEEATSERDQMPHVGPARDLAYVTAWARALETPVAGEGADVPVRGMGTLRANRPGDTKEKPLRLAKHEVKVTLRGSVARTEVIEEFANPTPAVMEGTYEFPLPPEATITRLGLWIGDKLEDGEIVENARAEKIYKAIVEDTLHPRDPALLRWKSGSTFSMKIFPIPANGSRKVLVEYTEVLAARYDRYKYVYPLARAGGEPVGEFDLRVDADAGGALGEVATPRWPASLERTATGATATFHAKDFAPAADFAFEYALAAPPPEAAVATFLGKDGHKYFMARLHPDIGKAKSGERHDYVFVVDTSYGVAPDAYRAQVATVAAFLAEMDERDQFKLLACDFVCRSYSDEFRRPTRREIDDVTGFLEGLSTGGSSDLDGAFRAAAAAAGSGAAGRAVRVVYVGDGVATSGAMRPDALVERIATHMAALPGVRIDVVGVGADVDRLALDEIARRFNGAARYVTSGGDEARAALEIVAAQYVAALSAPEVEVVSPASSGPVRAASAVVPTDTVLLADRMAVPPGTGGAGGAGGTPGALGPLYGPRGKAALPPPAPLAAPRSLPLGARIAAEDVFPRRLPTVQEGDELLVVGRFEGEGEAEIVLRGMVGDAAWMKRWPVTLRAEATKGNAFLPALWGRAKVDALTLADPAANKDEIVRVSFDTSVMSRYTSFLVLENERMYREFKVARKTDRDLWTGDEAPALDATETPASAPDDASGKRADEGGDDRSKAGEKAEEKPPAGATPAAGTGAPATAALPGIVGGLEAKGGKAGGAPSITARLGAAGDGDRGGAGKSGAAPSGTESTAGSLEEGARTRRKGTPARSGKMAMGSDADEHETGGADETDDLIDAGHKDDGKAAKDAPPVSAVAPTTPVGASGPGPAHATTTKHAPAGPMKVPAEPAPVTTPAGGGAGGMVAPPASDKEPEALKADKSRYAPPPPAAPKPEPPPKKPSKDAPADAKAKKRVLIEADKIEIVEASKPGFVRVPVKVATIAGAPVRADAAAPAAAVAALRAKVDAGPDVRANREALLKRLVRLGRYDEARAEAEKWLALDAESPAPLEWLGDLALQAGDLPRAVRLYDSLAELTPSVAKLHERLARMHAAKGDAGAACAHRRAAIEVAGDAAKTAAAALELARCERSLGHEAEATVAAKAGLASLSRASVHAPAPVPVPVLAAVPSASGWVRLAGYTSGGMAPSPLPAVPAPLAAPAVTYAPAIQRALEKFLADKPGAAAPAKPRLPGGELVAELRWDSPADLDVALVPPKGDRLGALKELRGIAVRDSLGGADGPERLAARELGTGTYLLVVSAAGGPVPAAVSGTLRVKARGATRTLAFTIPAGKVAAEVASVSAKIVYTFPGYGDALE